MMEAEDIELWYEEQKQKLSDRYVKSIAKGMSLEKREKFFNKAMFKLNNSYNKKQQKHLQSLKSKKLWKERRENIFEPVSETGTALAYSYLMLTGGAKNVLNSSYCFVKDHGQLFWTKRGYRTVDYTKRVFRPWYVFYAKHLKYPLIVITKPFVKFGNWLGKKKEAAEENTKKGAKVTWKAIVLVAKFVVKHSVNGSKKISGWVEGKQKRYNEWYAKRVQAALDRKHDREEKKKQKQKEKEDDKNEKEEVQGEASGQ